MRQLPKVLVHALAWLVFIFYEVSIVLFLTTKGSLWWEYLGYYLINISLFYFHAHVLLNRTMKGAGLMYALPLLIPLELTGYTLFEFGLEQLLDMFRAIPKAVVLQKRFIIGCIWRGFYFIGLSTAYWFIQHTLENYQKINALQTAKLIGEREKVELEKDLVESHIAFLQAQINPHLLFNTLNFIYNAVQDISPKASNGVLLLSDIMHYALNRTDSDGKTDLSNEIEHIKNYIQLNQLRFNNTLHLQLDLQGEFEKYRIPPLMLLTLVENIYKHGDLTDISYPALIRIHGRERLHFSVRNKKKRSFSSKGYGIGVKNVETRLQNTYKLENYSLHIQEDENYYSLNLEIKLD